MFHNTECDCLICNYRNLDFGKFLNKLKLSEGNEDFNTLEYAYGHYLAATNDFKKSYLILKAIEKNTKGKQNRGVEYFLVKQNLKLLHNLLIDYKLSDSKEMMNDIKSIDLDKVIYDEIEFDVENEVRKYLIDIKEDVLVYKLQDQIEETLFKIEKLKKLYDDGGGQQFGPNLYFFLKEQYLLLHSHVHRNFIFYDIFKRYKALSEKVFKGLVISHNTPEFNLREFDSFFLTEAILHVSRDAVKEILKDTPEIRVQREGVEHLLNILNNYTSSAYSVGAMGSLIENTLLTEHLNHAKFDQRFNSIFPNLFTVLVRLNITKEEFDKCTRSLVNFLKIEKRLAWYEIEPLSNFIYKKGELFSPQDLIEILQIGINGHGYGLNKYEKIINLIPLAIVKFHSSFTVSNKVMVQSAILKCHQENGSNVNYADIINLYAVCDKECKQLLTTAIENSLNEKFNYSLYEKLLLNTEYDLNKNNYFKQYTQAVNISRSNAYRFGEYKFTDIIFINYIITSYKRQLDFTRSEFSLFTGLNEFETWLLNPLGFNYENFDAKWLIDVDIPVIMERIKGTKEIAEAIDKEILSSFNSELAEIKYKYFA